MARRRFGIALLPLLAGAASAATATIDTTRHFQRIEGFGASGVYYQGVLTGHSNKAAIYDTIFTGLGLSYLRMGNWAQNLTAPDADVEIIKEGRKRLGTRMKIELSSWSPPGSLKASGQINGKGYTPGQNTLRKVNGVYDYAGFAQWWRKSLLAYQAKGVYPDDISIQNEPDYNADYEGCVFSPTEGTSAGYGKAFQAVHDSIAGMPSRPRMLGPEVTGIDSLRFQEYVAGMDRSLVDLYATHLYIGNGGKDYEDPDGFNLRFDTLRTSFADHPMLMTEFGPQRTSQVGDGMKVARLTVNALVRLNSGGYVNWELFWAAGGKKMVWLDPNSSNYTIHEEYHAMRHFSKFISPGWHRVAAASTDTAIKVCAFTGDAGDSVTLVALNVGSAAATLSTGGRMNGSTDVWQTVTSGVQSGHLAPLAANGTGTLSLPGNSITTVVWKASPNSSAPRRMRERDPVVFTGRAGSTLRTRLSSPGAVSVRDLSGHELVRQPLPAGSAGTPLGMLARGGYIAQVRQGNESRSILFALP